MFREDLIFDFQLLVIIEIFTQINFDYDQIWIFRQDLIIWAKISIFRQDLIFRQNLIFCPQFRSFANI